MKKTVVLLAVAVTVSFAAVAQPKIKTIKEASIFGQSCRTAKAQGSVLSLSTGQSYSLALEKKIGKETYTTAQRDIDILLFFGKVNRAKMNSFNISALNNPNVEIDWTKDGGTTPFCKFEGSSSEPDGPMALKNWTVRNATKLQRVTEDDAIDFDKITPEQIAAL